MSKPTYDPYALLDLLMKELAHQGIKTRFSLAQLGDAVPAAEDLLSALGVTPAAPLPKDIPNRKEVPDCP
ncbi:hypothetical protein GCM10023196_004410 [Actinoallomurus vinaceus]|uniref:Uncharacterized protein n=1 Tax=Actinoallomurus vinaceus TaxID=1080074 RepID=A0ABP8TZR7_9ACTN